MSTTPTAAAWLLPLEHQLWAAVGVAELFYLLDQPALHFIPCAPAHCCHLLPWETLLLPCADPSAWVLDTPAASHPARLAAVIGYLQADGRTAYGALRLAGMPQRITVTDIAPCALPQPRWAAVAHTAFIHQEQMVAVLALDRLFQVTPSLDIA